MNYFEQKKIVTKLHEGSLTHVSAEFLKTDQENILDLIANDLIKASSFLPSRRTRFGIQNLAEASPVTLKGGKLFNIP